MGRKHRNGRVGIVKNELKADVMGGDYYLFVNIRRTGCEVLLRDGTGLCIFMKKLQRWRFADLWSARDGAVVRLTSSELTLLIENCALA